MATAKTAWIAGASGLVGGFLLAELLASQDYAQVVSLVRRPSNVAHPKLRERVVDFANLEDMDVPVPDDVHCTLGTTIKKAGSQSKFRDVDFEYPLKLADLAKSSGATQFLLVSSVGADEQSGNFYLRTKGQLEEALRRQGFSSLHVFRPSILVGHRQERRPAERIAIPLARAFAPLMVASLRKYRPIQASSVARAMSAAARLDTPGVQIHEFDSINQLARY